MIGIAGIIIRTAGYLLAAVFVIITLAQVFLPDMMFALVSLRNRHGRKRANVLFLVRNMILFLVPGIMLVVFSGNIAKILGALFEN